MDKSVEKNKQKRLESKISAMAEKGLCSHEDAVYIKEVTLGLHERFGVEPAKLLTLIKEQLFREIALRDWNQ